MGDYVCCFFGALWFWCGGGGRVNSVREGGSGLRGVVFVCELMMGNSASISCIFFPQSRRAFRACAMCVWCLS